MHLTKLPPMRNVLLLTVLLLFLCGRLFLILKITDAKALARWIRSLIENGLPTSKADWRHAIVELAPKAITIKPGVPLIAQLINRIPLEELEKTALDKLLREAGLE